MQDSVVRRTAGLVKGLVGGQVARTYKAEWDLLSKKWRTYIGRNKRHVYTCPFFDEIPSTIAAAAKTANPCRLLEEWTNFLMDTATASTIQRDKTKLSFSMYFSCILWHRNSRGMYPQERTGWCRVINRAYTGMANLEKLKIITIYI